MNTVVYIISGKIYLHFYISSFLHSEIAIPVCRRLQKFPVLHMIFAYMKQWHSFLEIELK